MDSLAAAWSHERGVVTPARLRARWNGLVGPTVRETGLVSAGPNGALDCTNPLDYSEYLSLAVEELIDAGIPLGSRTAKAGDRRGGQASLARDPRAPASRRGAARSGFQVWPPRSCPPDQRRSGPRLRPKPVSGLARKR
ncbi:hypothetical protein FAGKG844_70117 [Frankia sp. AgKG'84/4]